MKQFVARILFFIEGPVPSSDDYDAADKLAGAQVSFRNASAIGPGDRPEACDGVAGAVPEVYKTFPTAAEAIKHKAEERKKALKESGDRLAPNPAAQGFGNPLGTPPSNVGTQAAQRPVGDADGQNIGNPATEGDKGTQKPATGAQTGRSPWGGASQS